MRKWALLLGGLLIWAAHFFLLYAVASIFPGTRLARWLTIGATGIALVANLLILRAAFAAHLQNRTDALERWIADLGILGAALSSLAVLWQAAPAVF